MTITATDIRHGLLKHFAPPAHRVFFEVSNDTGAKARRWIDAVAVGIWPSTGHEIIGIEIKVSRGRPINLVRRQLRSAAWRLAFLVRPR